MRKKIPHLTKIKTHKDNRGKLGIVEALPDCGFPFKRLYFLYGNNQNAVRGEHAHKALWQYMVAINGAFDIILKGGNQEYKYSLVTPEEGLMIPPGYWRKLTNFSADTICLVAASEEYDEDDYIHDYNDFLKWEETRD